MPADDQGQRALAQSYMDASAEMEDDVDIEGMELGMVSQQLSEKEVAEGVKMMRSFVEELGQELLAVSRDDVEEVSDLLLSASRVWLQLFQRATHRALKALEGSGGDPIAEEASTGGEAGGGAAAGAVVEEATEEEIAAFYTARGLTPPHPPASASTAAPIIRPQQTTQAAAPPATKGRGRRRYKQPPPRVLWQPLAPQLGKLTKETLPTELRAHPFKTAGVIACVLPFSPAILFCMPGVLVTDHFVLQKLYARFGAQLEEAVDDVLQVGRLGFVISRLSLRQSYRVARRQLRKAQADPKRAVSNAGAWAWDAATHPVVTAMGLVGFGQRGVASTMKLAGWLRAQLAASHA